MAPLTVFDSPEAIPSGSGNDPTDQDAETNGEKRSNDLVEIGGPDGLARLIHGQAVRGGAERSTVQRENTTVRRKTVAVWVGRHWQRCAA